MPVTTGLVLAGLGAVGKGVQYGLARRDEKRAKKELAELQKTPWSKYSVSPEVSNFYGRVLNGVNNPMGLTAAEKAQAQAGINTAQNTQMYNVQGTSGGNLSRYISGAINNQGVQAQNQLAATDARLRQQNYMNNLGMLGSASNQIQNIGNMNTQQELNRRMLLEQSLGGAALNNKRFQNEAIGGMSSDLMGAGLMMGMGGNNNDIPFAGVRNYFSGKNTSTTVDPNLLKTDPLNDYRITRSNLNTYFK
jgi:hypothetical protein